ncbi:MAG TPA: LpxD N-terminal domain-containing protein, partial [Phycisphaerae bacterium]|nr:LpxD N-terminal domain-containing protein [Phycisphaerae bacterium]
MAEQPSITVAELARRLGGSLEGVGGRVVWGVEPLDQAGPEAVSWLGSARYLPQLADTEAGVVLVPEDCEVPAGKTVIRVSDPDAALCEVLRCLAPPSEPVPVGVHPTAVIGEGAVVGPGAQLHPGVRVGAAAKIGRDCVLWPNVVVRERVTIGDRV